MDARQASEWISVERLTPFRRATGDLAAAIALYEWHVELSAALLGLVHRFEVLVRNAIDGALAEGQPQAPLQCTWMLDFEVLRPFAVRQVAVAVERLERGTPITRANVVAHLSLGFWVRLFDHAYEQLWRERIHRAFMHGAPARRDVGEPMRRIHALRNRVAHHACLLDEPIAARVEDMLTIAGWVDPAAAEWLRRVADVEGVLRRRP